MVSMKTMRLKDIVLMNLAAIIGLRWLPIAAGYGAAAIFLWVLATLLFFVPLSLISSELATTWPEQGGLYVWVKAAFGDKAGFMVSWFYWITNFFFYPALLTFIAVTFVYIFEPALVTNKLLICSIVLIVFWLMTLLNCRGMKMVSWIANIGGSIGVIIPGIIIIALGFAAVFIWKKPIPTDYSLANWIPNFHKSSNIVFLSTLMFSMAGIELTPILAGETKDPQKTLPRAILLSAILIIGIYILGTVAVTFMIPAQQIAAVSGIMDALKLITVQLHLTPLILIAVASMIIIGCIGGLTSWFVVPLKMFFESTKQGVLPKPLIKLNKQQMPANAMIAQAVVVSVIIIGTTMLPSVNALYETLVLMTTITYFVPYLFMFITFIKLRRAFPHKVRPYRIPGKNWVGYMFAISGFIVVAAAIVLPFIMPPNDLTAAKDILIYRTELTAGLLVFFALGYAIYRSYEKRKAKEAL
jgi:amino acid transporter